jgi:hypothetical protein
VTLPSVSRPYERRAVTSKKTPNTDLVEPEEGARGQMSLGKS